MNSVTIFHGDFSNAQINEGMAEVCRRIDADCVGDGRTRAVKGARRDRDELTQALSTITRIAYKYTGERRDVYLSC